MPNSYDSLYQEYRRKAKRANQRLVRLEQYSKREKNKEVLRYAYGRAQRDIASFWGKDKARWPENPDKAGTETMIREQLSDINRFLESETSTIGRSFLQPGKGGIKDIYEQRAIQFNKEFGTELTGKQITRLMESGGLFDLLEEKFSASNYRTAIHAASQVMASLSERGKASTKKNILEILDRVKFEESDKLDKEIRSKFKEALDSSNIKARRRLI